MDEEEDDILEEEEELEEEAEEEFDEEAEEEIDDGLGDFRPNPHRPRETNIMQEMVRQTQDAFDAQVFGTTPAAQMNARFAERTREVVRALRENAQVNIDPLPHIDWNDEFGAAMRDVRALREDIIAARATQPPPPIDWDAQITGRQLPVDPRPFTFTTTNTTTGVNTAIPADVVFGPPIDWVNRTNRIETRNQMNYDQLRNRVPVLIDRYFPSLSNKAHATRAYQMADTDPAMVADEKAYLQRYVETNPVPASTITYRWCDECESMVGYDNHTHCPHCSYPAIPKTGEHPDRYEIASCGFCGECCAAHGHRYCHGCKSHIDITCRYCQKCTACCACKLCDARNCQEMLECNDCKKCFDHCICVFPKTNGIYGKTFPANKQSERSSFDCQRFVGVEWEYNRLTTNKYLDRWLKRWLGERHEDASCGHEAVSPPMAGDYMVKCLTDLGEVFLKSKALIDTRCSIHVHVNASDLQWSDMFRFLNVYSKIEPILYLIAGQERLSNRYCVPCGKDFAAALNRVDRKDAIMAVAFSSIARDGRKFGVDLSPNIGREYQRAKPGKRADNHLNCRRKGLNILPWLAGRGPRPNAPIHIVVQKGEDSLEKISTKHNVSVSALMRWNKIKQNVKLRAGTKLILNKRITAPDTTVEFRIHSNTLDHQKVINWTKVVCRLVDWAAKSTDKDLETLPKSPLRILCQVIAPECAPWILSRVKEWRKQTSRKRGEENRMIRFKNGSYIY